MTILTWGLENETIESWAWRSVFNDKECDSIIDIGKSLETLIAKVDDDVTINTSVRKTNISWIPVEEHTKWIFQRCTEAINDINKRFFNFDLIQIESLQFTAYDEHGSFYDKHIDIMPSSGTGNHRKLSFSIQLSNPEDYTGGDLNLHYKKSYETAKKDRGVATFFPSYCLHEVTPITSGKRYSLVGWVSGPKFK
jgi:PKHD-type hydroxylase